MAFDGKSLDDYEDVATRHASFRKEHPDGRIRPADPAMPYHVVRVPNGWCVKCKGAQVVKDRSDWKKCPRCQGSGVRREDEPQEDVFIVYAAAVYRDAGDTEPGVGMAWERYPGRTPYTADSELMNAETSAWGRAMVAALVADARKGVASKDEIRNRDAEHEELREGTARGRVNGAKRGPVPPAEDVWQDQPPGEFTTTPPEERTGSIDGKQRSRIFAEFKRLGVADAGEQRTMLSRIVGRDVSSRKGLSYVDAEKVVKALKERQPEPQPEAATP